MGRKIDRISICAITFILFFAWGSYFIKKLTLTFLFAFLITFLVALLVLGRKGNKKPYSYERLMTEFCLKGNEYAASLIYRALSNPSAELLGNIIKKECALFVCSCKFSALNKQDMAGIVNSAKKEGASEVYILCRGIERGAYNLVPRSLKVKTVKIAAVYKFLDKKNLLPELSEEKSKFTFSLILESVFRRGAFKYYMFSGAVLILMSFLTPLRIYYITMGSISLLFALLTLTPLGKGGFKEDGPFKKFEDSNQITIDELLNDNKE